MGPRTRRRLHPGRRSCRHPRFPRASSAAVRRAALSGRPRRPAAAGCRAARRRGGAAQPQRPRARSSARPPLVPRRPLPDGDGAAAARGPARRARRGLRRAARRVPRGARPGRARRGQDRPAHRGRRLLAAGGRRRARTGAAGRSGGRGRALRLRARRGGPEDAARPAGEGRPGGRRGGRPVLHHGEGGIRQGFRRLPRPGREARGFPRGQAGSGPAEVLLRGGRRPVRREGLLHGAGAVALPAHPSEGRRRRAAGRAREVARRTARRVPLRVRDLGVRHRGRRHHVRVRRGRTGRAAADVPRIGRRAEGGPGRRRADRRGDREAGRRSRAR